MRFGWISIAAAALLLAAAGEMPAFASTSTPEIDPSTMSAGLAVLAGGVLMVTSRFRRH